MSDEETQPERWKPFDLAAHTIGSIPTLIYIPNFITHSDQSQLLHHIYQAPSPQVEIAEEQEIAEMGSGA